MDNQQIRELLIGVLIPAAAGLIVGLLLRLRRSGDDRPRLAWIAPLGIAVGFLLAQWRINGLPGWPLVGSESRLFALVAALGLVCAVLALPRRNLTLAAAVLAAVAVGPAILWSAFRRGPGTDDMLWAGGAAVGVLALALPAWVLESRGAPRTAAVLLAGTAAAAAGALAASHSLKLAQFAMAGAAATLAAGLLARSGSRVWLGPALAVSAGIAGATLLAGGVYSDLPWYAAVILVSAPVAGLLAGSIRARPDRPIRTAAIRIATAALIAAAGVGAAAWPDMMGTASEYDY